MSEVERRYTRPGWRYVFGVISLVLAGISGASLATLAVAGWLAGWILPAVGPGDVDAPGLGIVFLFFVAGGLFLALTALFLSAISLLKPGRGWPAAVAGWMLGSGVLLFASVQTVGWNPLEGQTVPPPFEAEMVDEGWVAPEDMVMEEQMPMPEPPPGAPPYSLSDGPPEAMLFIGDRAARGFEGVFCWTPRWAETCVEDAGIPLPPESEVLAVRQDELLNLNFVRRPTGGDDPKLIRAVAYPLDQASETVPVPMPAGYLVPAGQSRGLQKQELGLLRNGTPAKVETGVPAGEYVFQVSARPKNIRGNPDTWEKAEYHFRVRVLPR